MALQKISANKVTDIRIYRDNDIKKSKCVNDDCFAQKLISNLEIIKILGRTLFKIELRISL